jgi:hypothetical protein
LRFRANRSTSEIGIHRDIVNLFNDVSKNLGTTSAQRVSAFSREALLDRDVMPILSQMASGN